MNVSSEDAQKSLDEAQTVAKRTRKSIAASYDSILLIMWGIIWIAAFLGTHYFLRWAWYIWMGLGGAGCLLTLIISWRQFRLAHPVKMPAEEKTGWRIFLFWCLLCVYM